MSPKQYKEALKELALYLGKKIDAIKTGDTTVDMSGVSKSLELLQGTILQQTSAFESVLNKASESSTKALLDTLASFGEEIKNAVSNDVSVNIDTESVVKAIQNLSDEIKKEKKPEEKKDTKEHAKTHKLLEEMLQAFKDIEIPKVDFSELIKTLKPKKDDSVVNAIKALGENLGEKIDKIKLPSEIKMSDAQVRALMASQQPVTTFGGTLSARNVTVANVSMTTANTEYSYTFPANTVGFYMKLRAQNAKFTYSWATGKMPTSGDGSAYVTTAQNFLNSRPDVDYGSKTIYIQSDVASQIMEIESNQL